MKNKEIIENINHLLSILEIEYEEIIRVSRYEIEALTKDLDYVNCVNYIKSLNMIENNIISRLTTDIDTYNIACEIVTSKLRKEKLNFINKSPKVCSLIKLEKLLDNQIVEDSIYERALDIITRFTYLDFYTSLLYFINESINNCKTDIKKHLIEEKYYRMYFEPLLEEKMIENNFEAPKVLYICSLYIAERIAFPANIYKDIEKEIFTERLLVHIDELININFFDTIKKDRTREIYTRIAFIKAMGTKLTDIEIDKIINVTKRRMNKIKVQDMMLYKFTYNLVLKTLNELKTDKEKINILRYKL